MDDLEFERFDLPDRCMPNTDKGTKMDRRNFLKYSTLASGALVVSGCAGGNWRTQQAGQDTQAGNPFAPWDALETAKPHDAAVLPAAAILAANPHNTQPWTMAVTQARFQVSADTRRHLGAFDPYRREMWIGLGAAIANAEIAGAAYGHRTGRPTLSRLDRNGSGTITLTLDKMDPVEHPLAPSIRTRRTNRAPYEDRAVTTDALALVSALVGDVQGAGFKTFDRDTDQGKAFAQATLKATQAINADHEMSNDAHVWFRGNARAVAKHRDGVSIPTAGLAPVVSLVGQLFTENDAQKSGAHWFRSTQRQAARAGGFGVITVNDLYNRHQQIAAGRLWQRLHLAFTAMGIAAQPMNQLPELVDRDRFLGVDRGWSDRLRAISGPGGRATLAFRFGYPTRTVPHSARRPLDRVLLG